MAQMVDKLDVAAIRERFSALHQGFTFFDAPGGSQVPDEVGDAVARTLREASANLGAGYETSRRVGEILQRAEANAARFLGCEPHEVIFGPNMTSLDFMLSRTAGAASRRATRSWSPPWITTAASRPGSSWPTTATSSSGRSSCCRTRRWTTPISRASCPTALGWSRSPGPRTRSARWSTRAGCASWPTGRAPWPGSTPCTTPPTSRSTSGSIDADVLICSPYKFCGPHLGVAYGRAEVIEQWRPYKARPAPTTPLGRRFETGTLPFELLAGFNATIDYLDSIGGFELIMPYERGLGERFLGGHLRRGQRVRAARDGGHGCRPS